MPMEIWLGLISFSCLSQFRRDCSGYKGAYLTNSKIGLLASCKEMARKADDGSLTGLGDLLNMGLRVGYQ